MQKYRAFTLVEVLVTISLLAILAVITLAAFQPAGRIQEANDVKRRIDSQTIVNAIKLSQYDNGWQLPTAGGNPIPTVVLDRLALDGVDAGTLDNLDAHLNNIPMDPEGNQYKVGLVGTSSEPVVGTLLSNGQLYVSTGANITPANN